MTARDRNAGPSGQRSRPTVDLTTTIGSLVLPAPVMTASGTSGHGDELDAYFPLERLGAVVVKSLSAEPWPGNPPPRVHETPSGMLNSVGLQGPGVDEWARHDLPPLAATGARVVVSIWGRRIDDYARAAALVARIQGLSAVEVNVSCPNVEDRRRMFAHSAESTGRAIRAVVDACELPVWAKLSPNAADLPEIAAAAHQAGAEAVTLVNTVLGMVIDVERRRPLLGGIGGGLSGPAMHPVAVRSVYDVHAALPDLPIVGTGGIASGLGAVELLLAGASAVQVGTATFRDPRAPLRIQEEIGAWCAAHGVASVRELVGGAHG